MQHGDGTLHPAEFWERRRAIEGGMHRPSVAIHHDVDVVGGPGFLMKSGECLVEPGDGYGWNAARIAQQKQLMAAIDLGASPRAEDRHGTIDVLLSFPGGYTYGHWLVDIAARIERVLDVIALDRLAFIVPGAVQPWMRHHLDAYDITPEAIIALSEGQSYRSATLALPLVRLSAYLPPFPHVRAFARLKAYGHRLATGARPSGERLFVHHRAQTSLGGRNVLGNAAELAHEFERLGFVSICPADMTMKAQISAFRHAKLVVGEASSALHNIIYASAATLIVLNAPSHKARLHYSICKLLGHRCSYLFGRDRDDGTFVCDPHALRDLISRLTALPSDRTPETSLR